MISLILLKLLTFAQIGVPKLSNANVYFQSLERLTSSDNHTCKVS